MRFLRPKQGDRKIIKNKFLFFPTFVENECRWLERATVEYKLDFRRDWVGIKFHDEDKKC